MLSSFLGSMLRPGLSLMRALSLRLKLIGIVLLIFVPLLVLLLQVTLRLKADADIAAQEADGAVLVAAAIDVVIHAQTHRGQTNALKNGDSAMAAPLERTRQALAQSIDALEKELRQREGLALETQWKPLAAELRRMAAGQVPEAAPAAFAWHSEQVQALRRLVLRAAENSGLLLDPEAATYLLMDLAVERMIPWMEALGIARGAGAGLLARGGDAAPAQLAAVLGRRAQLQDQMLAVRDHVEALQRAGEKPPAGFDDATAATERFAALMQQAFTGEAGERPTPAAYFAVGTEAVGAVSKLRSGIVERLLTLLEARRAQAQRVLAQTVALVLCGVLLELYGMVCFYVSFIGAMSAISRNIELSSAGDLTTEVRILGRDEIARMGAQLEILTSNLSQMVGYIRSSAALVGDAGIGLASGTKALSERTEQQAASLEQTSASLQELNEAVARNTSDAQTASTLARQVDANAAAGNAAMGDAVQRVNTIEAGSRRIGEIIGVIDTIAFQTNILALNAAVESARAGEHGRGFAVVAAEVRQLAQRSAQSAGEIRQLVVQSSEQVEAGVAAIQRVATTFEQIVSGITELSAKVEQIFLSSQRQSEGLRQISQAVQGLDQITQQNAGMVEHHAQAATELNQRATQLQEAVSSMRLRHGTADEARTLVQRAHQLVTQRGLAAARPLLESETGDFRDRDLYIFVVNRKGLFEAFGANPALVGQAVAAASGIDAASFVRDSFAAADAGGGWVDYEIRNPVNGLVQEKQSYVLPVGNECLIGCGVYRARLQSSADAQV